MRPTAELEAGERGCLVVDENYMTTRPGVFSAGDVASVAKTIVYVVEAAKTAAQAIMCYMEKWVIFSLVV